MLLADTSDITSAPVTGRRRLGAGLFATVIGAGITAGAAASVADLVPANPDAELIDLCTRFDVIEREHYTAFIAWSKSGNDDQADMVMDRMAAAHASLLTRIAAMPPVTLAGAVALAQTLEQWSHGDFARHDYTDERLARTLIRGLVGKAAA